MNGSTWSHCITTTLLCQWMVTLLCHGQNEQARESKSCGGGGVDCRLSRGIGLKTTGTAFVGLEISECVRHVEEKSENPFDFSIGCFPRSLILFLHTRRECVCKNLLVVVRGYICALSFLCQSLWLFLPQINHKNTHNIRPNIGQLWLATAKMRMLCIPRVQSNETGWIDFESIEFSF